MRVNIAPFTENDLEEAAQLLAYRYQEDFAHERALPERWTQPEVARAALEKTWQASRQSGAVARAEGKMLGYLIGVPRIGGIWGRGVWVELAGHAVNRKYGAEVYRDLYAALSPSWVAQGCLTHFAMIPAWDREALDAWFNLSFGKEQVHAIRETAPASAFDIPLNPELEVRRAVPDDLDATLELDDIISIQHSRSPVFAPCWPYDREEARRDSLEGLHNEKEMLWLALREGRLVGYELFMPSKEQTGIVDLFLSPTTSYLAIGAVREEEQGKGIARALTVQGLVADYEAGYTHCVTDWRAANLLASRAWPSLGFRPVAYRLSRRLDERILWAHGKASATPWLAPGRDALPFTVTE